MNISWKSEKVKQELEDTKYLLGHFDKKEVGKIGRILIVLDEIEVLSSLSPVFHCHPLRGKLLGLFAIDIPAIKKKRGGNRLLLKPVDECTGETDPSKVSHIEILGIKNYHR